jgi:hypothetical protein
MYSAVSCEVLSGKRLKCAFGCTAGRYIRALLGQPGLQECPDPVNKLVLPPSIQHMPRYWFKSARGTGKTTFQPCQSPALLLPAFHANQLLRLLAAAVLALVFDLWQVSDTEPASFVPEALAAAVLMNPKLTIGTPREFNSAVSEALALPPLTPIAAPIPLTTRIHPVCCTMATEVTCVACTHLHRGSDHRRQPVRVHMADLGHAHDGRPRGRDFLLRDSCCLDVTAHCGLSCMEGGCDLWEVHHSVCAVVNWLGTSGWVPRWVSIMYHSVQRDMCMVCRTSSICQVTGTAQLTPSLLPGGEQWRLHGLPQVTPCTWGVNT